MGKLDLSRIEPRTGSGYPEPYRAAVAGRSSLRLGAAGGLTQFGVNLITLAPGAWSSQRHWHLNEDEFVMVTGGELTLITDDGEEVMRPGDCAAFPAGKPDGHHLVNRGDMAGSASRRAGANVQAGSAASSICVCVLLLSFVLIR